MTAISPVLDDYLEVVFRLQSEKQFARVSDISTALGVGKSAVTSALKSLSGKGLVNYTSYEPVTLSDEGRRTAEGIIWRRRIIQDFLERILGVNPGAAEATAGKMEHTVDKDVLDRFVCFLAFISTAGKKGKTWREDFGQFIKKGTGSRSCRQCIDAYLKSLEPR
jgi:DtxR family transcriptional regulator, Mn-dependent transcriptional regulator